MLSKKHLLFSVLFFLSFFQFGYSEKTIEDLLRLGSLRDSRDAQADRMRMQFYKMVYGVRNRQLLRKQKAKYSDLLKLDKDFLNWLESLDLKDDDIANVVKTQRDGLEVKIEQLNNKLKKYVNTDDNKKNSEFSFENSDKAMLCDEVERLEKQKLLLEKIENHEKHVDLEKDIKKFGKDVEGSKADLRWVKNQLSQKRADLIFRAIVGEKGMKILGEDWESFGDEMWEGFYNGVMWKVALPVGDAIGETIEGYIKKIFKGTLGKLEDGFGFLYRLVFHSAKKPFQTYEIQFWKRLIGNDLRQIEMMIKNVEKLDSRGRSDILRECEEGDEEQNKNSVNLWYEFIEDIAYTCQDIAEEIDLRKDYYKKDAHGFGIVNCAERLKNKLLKLKDLFFRVKSLRDFADLSEAKSIIPAMKKSLDNYFDNLEDQVKPIGKQGRYGRKSRFDDDEDDDDSDSMFGSSWPM